jgi:glycosyltransferase involved in cell wall biosynthesis
MKNAISRAPSRVAMLRRDRGNLDSGSADRTRNWPRNWARASWRGWRGYAGQKNWAAEQATHDWILSLDADEALSEGWRGRSGTSRRTAQIRRYTMPRLARYLGRWILAFAAGIRTARSASTTGAKAKFMGDFVHESVQVSGRVGTWNRTCCTSPAIRFPSM